MKIEELITKKILILDGAMGTMIQRFNLNEEDFRGTRFSDWKTDLKGNNDLLSITQPKIIKNIHLEYFEAGADIIETNTFNSNRISMADYNMQDLVNELNYASVQVAKQAREEYWNKNGKKPLFIAGSIGPTSKTASISPDVNDPAYREVDFDFLAGIYKEQAISLINAGADVLLVETIFDTLNAKSAFFGIKEAFDETGKSLPLMASGTITDAAGRTLSGQTTEAFLVSLSHIPLLSIGLNCALGAEQLFQYLEILANKAPYYISAYPNAGLPNPLGGYDETPEMMAEKVQLYLENQLVNILGGCCGTTPAHIKLFSKLASKYIPRQIPPIN
ncbi:MAG: homocysteine S-methyltransferase family protein [Apibacter sp.]|jgi:5-methyltetrahydrofolate--homocysteine methyltransferase|uniref:Methionine synthase n=1 Tax=Apibacter mensalis TaxID=1586267 RepID=A0A0X3ALK9_9FLAO|nr:homocysteine S-methyltransferase family protein [Apibacter mensalis]MCO6564801.1 homocysteine S-methyltransferase family protein [Apibacter sp.]CVK15204.1 5-methyltetrahydrofolate--homocysteine methyltransferase [Apibacter mensalis]